MPCPLPSKIRFLHEKTSGEGQAEQEKNRLKPNKKKKHGTAFLERLGELDDICQSPPPCTGEKRR